MQNVLIKNMWTFEPWFCRERLETINAFRSNAEESKFPEVSGSYFLRTVMFSRQEISTEVAYPVLDSCSEVFGCWLYCGRNFITKQSKFESLTLKLISGISKLTQLFESLMQT